MAQPETPVVTDEPGWLVYYDDLSVIDLTGESTPEVLACLDVDGGFDEQELKMYLLESKAGSVVIWSPFYDVVFDVLRCRPIGGSKEASFERPRVCAVTSTDAF